MKIILLCGMLAFGLISCSQSENSKTDIAKLAITNDSSDVVKTNPKAMVARAEPLIDYNTYVSVTDARFTKNESDLKEIKKNFKSDINAIQFQYDQELYALSKRNLEIKTKIQKHKNQDPKVWKDFKTTTNDELIELENSIRELAERVS